MPRKKKNKPEEPAKTDSTPTTPPTPPAEPPNTPAQVPPVEPPKTPTPQPQEVQVANDLIVPVLPEPTEEEKAKMISELNILNGRIREYMKCFLLLGYNLDGLPAQIVSAKTRQDVDSLNVILHRFLLNNSSGPGDDQHAPENI